ncbi:MAG: PepSY-like domain-containing protein [Bacteroidota bacterium]
MRTVNLLRSTLFTLLVFSQLLAANAFAADPPDSVEKTFKEQFPQAENYKWIVTNEKNKEYAVEFTLGRDKLKAYYNTNGNLVETEKEMNPDLLPALVKQALETQFQHFKIIKSLVIEKNNKVSSYELVIKSDGVKTTMIMSTDGYMIAR